MREGNTNHGGSAESEVSEKREENGYHKGVQRIKKKRRCEEGEGEFRVEVFFERITLYLDMLV